MYTVCVLNVYSMYTVYILFVCTLYVMCIVRCHYHVYDSGFEVCQDRFFLRLQQQMGRRAVALALLQGGLTGVQVPS